MATTHRHFVPAAGHDWLLPFYDSFTSLVGGDALREDLVRRAAPRAEQKVLDVGCGTGSLLVRAGRQHPDVRFVGIDPDLKALSRARAKASGAGLSLEFEQGYADALAFPDATFDQVWSSLMFHHLDADTKRGMLEAVRRVLVPGGAFHLMDFGGAAKNHGGFLARLLHAHETVGDNLDEGIQRRMRDAAFSDVTELGARRTLFGHISHCFGRAPLG